MQQFARRPAFALHGALPAIVLLGLPTQVTAQHEHQSSYAGHESMEISSLSPDQFRELSAGEGMGLARAAELNHFPGPKHALELATELGLSKEQVERLMGIRETMLETAIEKGAEIIDAESDLTELFRAGSPNDSTVRELTRVLGGLYGELRAIHLVAHLRTVEVMTEDQVVVYDRLRGYGA